MKRGKIEIVVNTKVYAAPAPSFHPRRFLTTPPLHCTNVVFHTPRESGQEADYIRGPEQRNEVFCYFLGRDFFKVGMRSGRIFSKSFSSRSIVKPSVLRVIILFIIALFILVCFANCSWSSLLFSKYFTKSSQISSLNISTLSGFLLFATHHTSIPFLCSDQDLRIRKL